MVPEGAEPARAQEYLDLYQWTILDPDALLKDHAKPPSPVSPAMQGVLPAGVQPPLAEDFIKQVLKAPLAGSAIADPHAFTTLSLGARTEKLLKGK